MKQILSLFFLVLLVGCTSGNSGARTSDSLERTTPEKVVKIENNRYKDDPMVQYFDVNKDGHSDMWKVYLEIPKNDQIQKMLIRREIDLNYDGIPDYVKIYSKKGKIEREFLDQNLDKQFETIRIYENNKVIRIEQFEQNPLEKDLITRISTIKPNKVHYFTTAGILKKITEDQNSDGKEDYFMYYLDGKLDRIGIDDDADLKIDRWIKRPEQQKKRKIRKRENDEK